MKKQDCLKVLNKYREKDILGDYGDEEKTFISAVLSTQYLKDLLINNSDDTLVDVLFKSYYDEYGKLYYPCDIIELRPILSERKIKSSRGLSLFAPSFAKQHFSRCPIFIQINASDLTTKYNYGGLRFFDISNLDISDRLFGISIQEPLDKSLKMIISNILDDTTVDFNVNFENCIPGITGLNPKVAQDVTKKYVYDKANENPVDTIVTSPLNLKKGDIVRWRNRGLLLNQYYGKVIDIDNKWIYISWNGRDKDKKKSLTKFPADNLALIFKYLAKVEI